jgi:hypothetical protein
MWQEVLSDAVVTQVHTDDVLFWRGNRPFTQADVNLIWQMVHDYPNLSRTELSLTLCEVLPWLGPNGRPRDEACQALLAELERSQGLVLPAKEPRPSVYAAPDWGPPPPDLEVRTHLGQIRPVTVELAGPEVRPLWNAMMAAYHPLGFQRAFGAHLRYFVYGHVNGERVILGGLLFAAAAKAVEARDRLIGWTPDERSRYRHHIIANSRYLILPSVHVPHLASHALAQALRRVAGDFERIYGYRPALVETFIEPPWRGTCYLASNFIRLGTTKGRGRQDREHRRPKSVKQVLVRPLVPNWRQALVRDDPLPREDAFDA